MRFLVNTKIVLFLTLLVLTVLFLFQPHYVELTTVIESWFPAKGLILYKETPTYHFPFGRLIALPLYIVTNWNLELTPFLGLFIGYFSLISLYFFGKKYLSMLGTSISLGFFTIFFWYSANGILFFHEMLIGALFIPTTFLFLKISDSKRPSPLNIFLTGVLLSVIELSGQVASLTVVVFGLLLVFLVWKKKLKDWKKLLGVFLAGIITPWVPFVAYFALNNALYDFYFWNIPYYLIYKQSRGSFWDLPFKDIFAFYTPLLASIVALLNFNKLDRVNTIILVLSLSTIPTILFSIFHPHHFNYALPFLALSTGFLFSIKPVFSTFHKIFVYIPFLFLCFVLITVIIPFHTSRIIYPPNFSIQNDVMPGTSNSNLVSWISENTNKDDTLLVIGNSIIYFRSDRLPSTRPSKGMPYSWEPFDKVKKEITASPSDYWVVDGEFTRRLNTDYPKGYMLDFINSELTKCYKLEKTFESWKVWSRTCE